MAEVVHKGGDETGESVKLFLSVPSNRPWEPRFGTSFADLLVRLTSEGIKDPGYKLESFRYQVLRQVSNLPNGRQHFVDDMIANNFTHWLSLDDDMTFPMDIVDRLISHGKDVVSCNAMRKDGTVDGSCQGMDGKPIDSTGKTGLQELRTMGGAIFLARIGAFKHIPKPHFQMIWSPAHNSYLGEDVYFSTILKMSGVGLYADHDTSQLISHIGSWEYQWSKQKDVVTA